MIDLRELVERDGPFLTAVIPARSDVAGASERFEVQVRNAFREAPAEWEAEVASMSEELRSLDHWHGEAVVAIRPRSRLNFNPGSSPKPMFSRTVRWANKLCS